MNSISGLNSMAFRGTGACESAGSIAYRNNPIEKPTGDVVNFKGYDEYYPEEKKKTSLFGVLAGVAILSAAVIGGLGYAHKAKLFDKANWLKKLEPAGNKCHEWCSSIKTKGVELWDKVKSFFSKKS